MRVRRMKVERMREGEKGDEEVSRRGGEGGDRRS